MAAVAAAVPRISTDGEALAVTVVTLGVARATVAPTFGRAASPRGRGVTVIGESPSIQAVHHFGAYLKGALSLGWAGGRGGSGGDFVKRQRERQEQEETHYD